MRRIVIGMFAGFAGTDAWEFYEVPDEISDEKLSDFAWERAKSHAEMYGVYPSEEYDEDEDDEGVLGGSYSDNIDGWWELYDPNEHDGHTMNGTPEWQRY